jgi:excisionase family DNA binding protein
MHASIIVSTKMKMEIIKNPKTKTESTGGSQDQQYMTREQVAELFQISTRTVSELTARGVIIAVKLGDGRNAPVRYRRETLEETAKKLERR